MQPQVLALDPHESHDLDNTLRRMEMEKYGGRDAVNANFLKSLKNIPSRVDSFQDKPIRRESIKRYQRAQASGAASTLTLA